MQDTRKPRMVPRAFFKTGTMMTATTASDDSVGSRSLLARKRRNQYSIMECACPVIHFRKRSSGKIQRIAHEQPRVSLRINALCHGQERVRGMDGLRSFKRVRLPFYGILWLLTVSLMPLAGAQPIVPPQPVDAPSGMMPTTSDQCSFFSTANATASDSNRPPYSQPHSEGNADCCSNSFATADWDSYRTAHNHTAAHDGTFHRLSLGTAIRFSYSRTHFCSGD